MKIELSHQTLNSIDFSRYKKYDLDIGNRYFYMDSGQEHYKLLAFLSMQFNNRVFLDIGTNHGCSALALAYNEKNLVHSIDIVDNKVDTLAGENNIIFKIGDALKFSFGLRPSIVFLDASKNDDFEQRFIDHILPSMVASRGFLILDDYYRDQVVKENVERLRGQGFPIYDLTSYGHTAGTHLVDFSGALEIE